MARIIVMDEDTSIGYSYPNRVYYVINKGTMTTRTTPKQALDVLGIVHPSLIDKEGKHVTEDRLITLASTLETLQELSYSLDDTGSYIRTIQLNTYKENPITIDLIKKKLYIMNTNIIFDLALNESSYSRVEVMREYYRRHLGIDLSTETLTIIYDFLTSFQDTKPYIQLNKHTDKTKPITYSYQIQLSNPTTINYTLLSNPNLRYEPHTEASISEINSNRVVILTQATPQTVHIGDTIQIDNATTIVDEETSYSSNGTYTISNIQDNLILVQESIPTYKTPMLQCYLQQPIIHIESVDRNLKQITLTSPVPTSILIGDTIHITNTTKVIDYQSTSIDGSYTVYSINGNILTVYEDIPTDYIKEDGETPFISKHVPLGEVLSIGKNEEGDKVITLTNSSLPTGLDNLTILVDNKQYTVKAQTTNTITTKEPIEDYTPNYAKLQIAIPYKEVKTTISKSDIEELPMGEFILDNPQECIDYLKLGLTDESVPTLDMFDELGGEVKPISIKDIGTMKLLGLYSEVYEDKTKG